MKGQRLIQLLGSGPIGSRSNNKQLVYGFFPMDVVPRAIAIWPGAIRSAETALEF
jgi:hypothetical protein